MINLKWLSHMLSNFSNISTNASDEVLYWRWKVPLFHTFQVYLCIGFVLLHDGLSEQLSYLSAFTWLAIISLSDERSLSTYFQKDQIAPNCYSAGLCSSIFSLNKQFLAACRKQRGYSFAMVFSWASTIEARVEYKTDHKNHNHDAAATKYLHLLYKIECISTPLQLLL